MILMWAFGVMVVSYVAWVAEKRAVTFTLKINILFLFHAFCGGRSGCNTSIWYV